MFASDFRQQIALGILVSASFGGVIPCGAGEIEEFCELMDFSPHTPDVSFDVPQTLVARDVTTDEFLADHPSQRLIEIKAPVSLLLYHGNPSRIQDVVIEIDGAESGLSVYDYAPRTLLASDIIQPIKQQRKTGNDRSASASLGGRLGTDITLTPTLNGGLSETNTFTETIIKTPPKRAVIVSGTTNSHQAVFFKLRKSTQATLEGEQTFCVTFAAPEDWPGGMIEVRCVARGQQKWMMVERRKVWSETAHPVKLRLLSYAPTPVSKAISESLE